MSTDLNDLYSTVSGKAEQLRFQIAQAFVFVLPFNLLFSNVALYLLLATTLLGISRAALKRIPKHFYWFQAVYFLALIGYLPSYHRHEAGFLLERQLAILFLPILLPLAFEFNNNRKKGLLDVFSLSQVISILYLFFFAFLTIYKLHLPLRTIFSKEFFNHQFSAPIGIHAGYLSLYVCLSIFHLLQTIYTKKADKSRKLAFLGLPVLTAGMLFLASRNVIISGLLILLFVFPFFYVKNKIRFYIVAATIALAGYFSITNISYLKSRFSSDLISDIRPGRNSFDNFNGVEPRIERWKCATNIIGRSPWFGYGTGDEIEMLKCEYMRKGLYISYLESFNAHNQYLSYLLKNGILGLILFLVIFAYYSRLALLSKNYIYICFLLLLLTSFLTENVLDANKGIFFFAFFNTFIGYTLLEARREKPAGPIE